jgi:DNA-binding MarR family transcriptional regulator
VSETAPRPVSRAGLRRLTTAVRDFRRVGSSNAFRSRWLGEGDDVIEAGQYDVLDRLVERDAWRMGELAGALHIDPSSVTRAVVSLERLGLVARSQDRTDKRCVLVHATAPGRERHQRSKAAGLALWDEALCDFADDDLDAFAGLMTRLTEAFQRLVLGPDPAQEHAGDIGPGGLRSEELAEVERRLSLLEDRLATISSEGGRG